MLLAKLIPRALLSTQLRTASAFGVTLLFFAASVLAQQFAPLPATQQSASAPSSGVLSTGITEDELKQMLVGKTFYLRGGYLDSSLSFSEHGALIGHSAQGSFTLSLIQIDRVRLAKRKVTLEGIRYGLHFLGALPYDDPSSAFDKVRITPKKKIVRITIDREIVVKPKKVKEEKPKKGARAETAMAQAATSPSAPAETKERSSESAPAQQAEQPVALKSTTTTTSPAHATKVLKDALDDIFAPNLDDRMTASLPDFWKLYYHAAASKTDYSPSDPAVQRQTSVDQKARLLTSFEPESNQYAQDNGVAGMALYHTVIGADGKPQEIAVARPIGFGLDENAVAAIRSAKFAPAMKNGQPVPVLLDLVVQFRIFSKRTATGAPVTANSEITDKSGTSPQLPGPYSAQNPQPQ